MLIRIKKVIYTSLLIYILSFFVVFDVMTPAYKFDEEYNGEQIVALGPRPRFVFCTPSYDINFDGSEWPFKAFLPFCGAWRLILGYAPPKQLNGRKDDNVELLKEPYK